ncbi:Ni/Fe hydrogenase subunit alpha [Desulfatiferula olefinivorans]
MNRTITIDPVTRIEGHARVFLNIGDDGSLASAGLVVNELRGFERILAGMEADRMPLITARICGVCPAAHHLAASKALDNAAGVTAPKAALLLRELLCLGHLIHSHVLSIFVLEGPDLVFGLASDPSESNVAGIVRANPELAKKALRCRSLGQKIGELVGGRGIHPVTSVAGGVSFVLDSEKKSRLQSWIEEINILVPELAVAAKELLLRLIDAHPSLMSDWVIPSWHVGTVQDGNIAMLNGTLRAVDATGGVTAEFPAGDYEKYMEETVVDWSYMKEVRLLWEGTRHDYRVGPLARVNLAEGFGTEAADVELASLRKLGGDPCHAVVFQAYARVVEILYAAERALQIITDPGILGETRVPVTFRGGRGVAHVEAPRGTLIHDYEIDENGIVRSANLIVATQQNYVSINRTIEKAAISHVLGKSDDAVLLNAVEFGIRCYDPCLSCATHALGAMPLDIVVMRGGDIVRTVRRNR